MSKLKFGLLSACLFFSPLVAGASFAQSQVQEIPVPVLVIYPGDYIDSGMIRSQKFLTRKISGMAVFRNSEGLLGMEAKRTLVPGRPIPLNGVQSPTLVKRGTPATLVFEEGGLKIVAIVEPLQSGGVGDTIKAKNIDTGLQVVGIVQEDGTLKVEGGN
ncbi:flagellar basal body P-ring formation chaperone FlgA [Flexibacterium corallicola]|uniref:flagellar basal body P-ring formation chaperone FlgA n=1 Tax=Flexibacterium corallicola TaxID=3037259 RepID=UPI00286F5E2D|nr:flagellar basal body P-ring formation chaperone FlgA [Pseudovibrio sp. M1P-2-3]